MAATCIVEGCDADPTANGRECPPHWRERLGSVRNGFTPSRRVGRTFGMEADRRRLRRLDDYAKARRQGMQPAGTKRRNIDEAVSMSDRMGEAFDNNRPEHRALSGAERTRKAMAA